MLAEIERDYPRSLERRPAQLVRAAGATAGDLTALVRAAGFVDLDDVHANAAREDVAAPRRAGRAVTPHPAPTELDRAMQRARAGVDGVEALRGSGELELAAGAVLGSRRRWVFGDLRSRGYAQLFAAELSTSLGQVTLIDPTAGGVLAAIGDAQRRDSLTVFTFRRYSRLAVRLAARFAARGATVVAITDAIDGPVAAHAAHVLPVAPAAGATSPVAAVAVGHALATVAATGAKGASRRAEHERVIAADLQWYEEDA